MSNASATAAPVLKQKRDWAKVWLDSKHRAARLQELEELHGSAAAQQHPDEEDSHEYAAPFSEQMKVCSSTRATSAGSEKAAKELGNSSGFSRVRVPAATSS